MAFEILGYRMGLTGRLHPAILPATLIGLLLIAGLGTGRGLFMKRGELNELISQNAFCDDHGPDVPPITMMTSVIAIAIFATGTRYLGVPLTVFVAVLACLASSRTSSRARRMVISAGLALLVTLIFIVVLRLPLPVLPGGRFW